MKAILKTFPVGCGDCITFHIESDDDKYNIMVDCGCYTEEVEIHVKNTFENHIHLLVVTHIDNDHIAGLKTMLSQSQNLIIDRIMFNCGQLTPMKGRKKLPDSINDAINKKKQRLLPKEPISGKTEIGAKDAMTLAEIILKNKTFRKAWLMNKSYITTKSRNFLIPNKAFGKLVFLSPKMEDLTKLDDDFRDKFNEKFYMKLPDAVENQEMLFEMLAQLVVADDDRVLECISSTSAVTLESLLELSKTKLGATSQTNKASIAFMWMKGEHSILFMGDASPEIVRECIKNKKIFSNKPKIVDAIKVSHHGSKHSVDNELADVVDSENYFFTGGSDNEATQRPCLEAIAKIICHKKPSTLKHRALYFNFVSDDVGKLINSSAELKSNLGFEILEGNEYEITF